MMSDIKIKHNDFNSHIKIPHSIEDALIDLWYEVIYDINYNSKILFEIQNRLKALNAMFNTNIKCTGISGDGVINLTTDGVEIFLPVALTRLVLFEKRGI